LKNKDDIRKEYLSIRKNIKDRKNKSGIIFKKIINNENYIKAKVVAIYKSLIEEVDTQKLIEYSINIGKKVLLPKIQNNEMNFFEIEKDEVLFENRFGIKEPEGLVNKIILKQQIDLMIIPGICFDRYCNRLGFGKGYYDRYLENMNVHKIGICFKEQIFNEELPQDKYDVKLDEIICD
jgi:5-formyltetrahydrofolate cyclo-ligase